MKTLKSVQTYLSAVAHKWVSGSAKQGRIFIGSYCRRQLEILDAPDHHVFEALKSCHITAIRRPISGEVNVEATATRPGYGTVDLKIRIDMGSKPSGHVVWVNDFDV